MQSFYSWKKEENRKKKEQYIYLHLFLLVKCTFSCENGYCSGPDACTCDPGFAQYGGVMSPCSAPVCTPACKNSICAAFGKSTACVCLPNWTGPDCSIPTCTANCGLHGACAPGGVCECYPGWQGDNCDQRMSLYMFFYRYQKSLNMSWCFCSRMR